MIKYIIAFFPFITVEFFCFVCKPHSIFSYIWRAAGTACLKRISGIHELKYWPRNATGFFFI